MNVKFEWQNPNQFLAETKKLLADRAGKLKAIPERAIRRGVVELLRLVQQHAPKKTSTLVRSLHFTVERIGADLVEGRVGTWLEYARYLEEGTGVFGPKGKPIEIRAKHARGLCWGAYDENGVAVIRKKVTIQGIKPRGYFAAAIAEFLPRYVDIILEETRAAA